MYKLWRNKVQVKLSCFVIQITLPPEPHFLYLKLLYIYLVKVSAPVCVHVRIQVTRPQMVYGPQTVDHDLFCPQTLHFQNFCLKITPNSLYMSFLQKKFKFCQNGSIL